MDFLLVAGGLIALYFGAEWLLKGSISLAQRLGLPTLIVSLVIVGFGTSMPELLVSIRAALSNAPDIALGNVVGSNIANVLLIIGASALICPMRSWDGGARKNAVIMVAISALLLLLVQLDTIGRLAGALMVGLLAIYLIWSYRNGQSGGSDEEASLEATPISPLKVTLPQIIGGLAVLFIGAELLIRGATSLARDFGISEAVIGLTVVAIGTSLPELATSIIAALRKTPDVAIGNVIGSNIFNILGILGVTAAVKPIGVSDQFAVFDVPVMLTTALVFVGLLFLGKPIGRLAGGALILAYVGYTALLF
jgi:cation:H+ antiporter